MRIMKLLFLVFFSLGLALSGAETDAGAGGAASKWREGLGASDFARREEVMRDLWKEGEKALALLRDLSGDRNPEVAMRARMVLRKIQLGINPDTPAKVVQLIEEYWAGSSREKVAILRRLNGEAGFEFLFRLAAMETDLSVRRQIDELVAAQMPLKVRDLLNKGKRDEAKRLLAMSRQFEHMIRLGHLLQLEGKLGDEIARLRTTEDPGEQKRYLAYLRVMGDPVMLRREAARLGDRKTELLAALVAGDFVPYFEEVAENGRMSDDFRNYLRWILAGEAGDRVAQEKILGEVLEDAKHETGGESARVTLFKMGHGDRVIASLPPERFAVVVDYHEMQEDFAKVEELLELPSAEKFDRWLEEWTSVADRELSAGGSRPGFDRLMAAVGFLEGRGRVEEAVKCCQVLFDLNRKHDDLDRDDWMDSLFYAAPKAVLTGVAREIDESEQVVSIIFQEIPRGSDYHVWLFSLLGEENPKLTTRERVLLTFSFSNRSSPLVDPTTFARYFERIFQRIVEGEDRSEELGKLSRLLISRNRGGEMMRVQLAKAEAGDPNHYFMGLLAYDSGEKKKAGESFAKVELDPEDAEPQVLFELGLLMQEAGLPTGDELLAKAMLYFDGSPQPLEAFAKACVHVGDLPRARDFYEKAVLCSEALPGVGGYSPMLAYLEELSSLTLLLKDWKRALAYREAYAMLVSFRAGLNYGHYYSRYRFQALVARGAVAMENGDVVEAVAAFGEAHRILPRDGYLANELFPVMREVGLSVYHDQLFALSARHAREMIERYPLDDNGYNNFAWMASRANRCLDEAEGYLKKALELNPQSAAYLDTMGEIYFARQNREEAVKWSRKSLANATLGEAMKWELHYQNQRFHEGSFPPK